MLCDMVHKEGFFQLLLKMLDLVSPSSCLETGKCFHSLKNKKELSKTSLQPYEKFQVKSLTAPG